MAKDINGYEFGVCEFDIRGKIVDLEILENYEYAYERYLERLENTNPRYIRPDLWIVWIKDKEIVQLEQLSWNTKSKLINIDNYKSMKNILKLL